MERKSGVLMHISSLWGEYSCGSFGKEAKEFIDFLSSCGFSYWQVLPFGLVDECNSPYKSYSTFGGNPYFVDLTDLFEKGLITSDELNSARQSTPYYCEFPKLVEERVKLLTEASKRAGGELREKINRFIDSNKYLKDFCVFMALKTKNEDLPWTMWQSEEYDGETEFGWRFIQYMFFSQWAEIKSYASSKGIGIIGDIPIYVSYDSADVYFDKSLFMLDDNNKMTDVAGVPPDYFAEDGQLWGNPLYDWAEMERTDYSWWKDRISLALNLFDGVRIDHFRAFESFWAVKGDAETAKEGRWIKGPGMKLINAIKAVAGDKLIIAEDLGDITKEVYELVEESGFPGMRVFQFGFFGGDTPHKPHNYVNNCVAYSGTHDNNTLLGYLWETPMDVKKGIMRYCSCNEDRWNEDGCRAIIKTIMGSAAGLTIFPIQDLLGYGSDTRLNVPGRAEGNWLYRITKSQLDLIDKNYFKDLNELYGR
ncbi:MAG: 4-alpha-glucanotransferase [Ruminococcaceae bacterium]|nr:4-alpha-glucanotransferase [Oscillospiraceae bacterium]